MSNKKNIQEEIESITKQLLMYDDAYYNNNESLVTDYEYDLLKRKLNNLQHSLSSSNNQLGLFENSISNINISDVGIKPHSKLPNIKHTAHMLSIDNAMNEEEVVNFIKKIQRFLAIEYFPRLVCELKIDGLSFSARYEDGLLKYVATRGDGSIGEDITNNAKEIVGFPLKLSGNYPRTLEARGEIYISKKQFESINSKLEKKFSNPRNAASGSIRCLDSKIVKERGLEYVVYSTGYTEESFSSQDLLLKSLSSFGFLVDQHTTIAENIEEVFSFYEKIKQIRHQIPFDIDGVVLKIDDTELQKRLGDTARSPRWMIAYKFSGLTAITKLIDITNQVGRTGVLTPVAELEPINIGGVFIKRATLHNYSEIMKHDLKIGDIVTVKRSGDVIPKIISVLKDKRNNNSEIKDITIPKHCPSCNSELVIENDTGIMTIKCTNINGCKDRIIANLLHFTSKDAFDINGLGEKQLIKFYELNFIKTFADIFKINKFEKDIKSLEGFGEKSYNNLIDAINSKRNIVLSKFIYSLGIEGIGESLSLVLAKIYQDIDKFIDDSRHNNLSQLNNVDGIGEKTKANITNYLSGDSNLNNIKSLLHEVTLMQDLEYSGKFNNKTIVFTGKFNNFTRMEIKSIAERHGFHVLSSVSKKTDFLVAGVDSGSKLDLAKELNIKILTEDEFIALTKNDNV